MAEESTAVILQYFKKVLTEDIARLFGVQSQIASKIYASDYSIHGRLRTKFRTNYLGEALANPQYSVTQTAEGVLAELSYPLQIRFLDMRKYGNWRIYNRQLWGIMYRETFNRMRYEFRDWAWNNFSSALDQAISFYR